MLALLSFAKGNIGPIIIGILILAVGGYVLYLRYEVTTWKTRSAAWEARATIAEAANIQVQRDQVVLEDKYKASQATIEQLGKTGQTKRDNIARIAGEANVRAENFRVEAERLRKEAATPSATAAAANDAAYKRLLGLAQTRPRR